MLASFCLPPMGSSRGQGMLLSEACSCSAEKRKRRPIIEIVKLPAVSRIRVRWRPPVSVPYTSLSTGLRLDTFGMKLRLRRWSGASATRRSKAAVRGWTSRCAKRPSWYQSDEACRSVIGGTRPPARGCFAKPTDRDYTDPRTLGPNCRLQRGVQPI